MSDQPTSQPVLQPTSETEVVELMLQNASTTKAPLVPVGGKNFSTYGYQVLGEPQPLSVANMNKVIDYPARDMTITVEAGITIKELQQTLIQEGQCLPIDVPFEETATLGGAVAANIFGPRGYHVGTWRDYVLGFSAVDGSGRLFKAGGRVVKNVAGYDLAKLMIGTHGTLGIFTQLTLKLRPVPQKNQFLCVELDSFDEAEKALSSLVQTETLPVAIELLNSKAIEEINAGTSSKLPNNNPIVLIAYEGSPKEVDWQLQKVKEELNSNSQPLNMDVLSDELSTEVWKALTQTFHYRYQAEVKNKNTPILFEASLKPSAAIKLSELATELECAIQCHTNFGFVRGVLPHDSASPSSTERINKLRAFCKSTQGHLTVIAANKKHGADIDLFDYDSMLVSSMQKMKAKFDPGNLLSPGKLFA